MAKQLRGLGRWTVLLTPLALLAVLLLRPTPVLATTLIPGANVTPTPECWCQYECPSCSLGASIWTDAGVNVLTREFRHFQPFPGCYGPTKLGTLGLGVLYRSYLDTTGQFGNGLIPSWETTVTKVITNSANPEGAYGHHVVVLYPTGLPVTFDWTGSAYTASSCGVTDTLSRPGGPTGAYLLTAKSGGTTAFDARGFPSAITDSNGNVTTASYNTSGQIQSLVDDRGGTYTFAQNSSGLVASVVDPTGRQWTFSYDTAGNLTGIQSPATAQQTSGITHTLGWDSYGRLTTISNGCGSTVKSITYSGSTAAVTAVTTGSDSWSFSSATNRTDMTDRLGNVHRYHLTGNKVTKTDMYVSGLAKYETTYNYGTGDRVVYIVYPRGNRVDFTWDTNGNLTERRHKTSNTSSTSSSDIVHTWTYSSNFMTSYTGPLSQTVSFTRDSAGNVTQITFPTVTSPATQTASRSFSYNTSGQLTQVTDEEGKVTSFTYHSSGTNIHLLQQIDVDPSGLDLETLLSYDSDFNVSTVTDPRGNTRSFTYDDHRRLLTDTTPSPLVTQTRYEYDCEGRCTKREVENRDKDNAVVSGNQWLTTTYSYGTLGDLTSITEEITNAITRTTTLEYDAEQQLTRVIKPEGNKVRYYWNERGLLWKVVRGETSAVASTVERTYDDNGNLVEEEDGRGNSTTWTFDLFDRQTHITNALGHYTQFEFDKCGRVTEVARKDSSNNTLLRSTRSYDERGRLWQVSDLRKDPGTTYSDAVTEIERYKTGHVHVVTDARGKETTYSYDNAWRRTKVTDHAGNFTEWTLDEAGNPTAWTVHDEDGTADIEHAYQATYDALNRRTTHVEIDRTSSSATLTTTLGYDSRGNVVYRVNPKGDPTMWIYDGLSRMAERRVALTTAFGTYIKTAWGFDKNNRLTSHKDDANNQTTWQYDALDRATRMVYPDASDVEYTYDANDNVVTTLDAAGNLIEDTYDVLNRRTQRDVTLVGAGFSDTTQETFEYDAADRMTLAEDDDYKVQFTHAVLGLASMPYEEKQSYSTGTAHLKTVTRTWDAVGNKATETYPSGLTLTHTWNDVNRLTGLSDGTSTIASWTYAGLRPKQVDYQNTTKTLYSYTGYRGEVATIHHKTSSSATILQLDYGYDANHDRTYERYGGSGSAGDAFEYDKARRLTVAWMGSATPTAPSGAAYTTKIDYAMDDTGNRTSVVTTPYGGSAATSSYTTNSLNQYTAVGGVSRGHDGNGNVNDDGTYTYTYNYKNLIVKATRKSDSAVVGEYKYDALGRRVEKVVTGATYRYIYSGVETVSVYTSTGTWKQDYVYGEDIDEVVMLEQADLLDQDADSNTSELTRSFYHRNALGSVMEITDMSQAVAVSYRYDPYGQVTITRNSATQTSDPLGQHVTYTGRWRDEETGLYHYRARAYDSTRGAFMQRDPLRYTAGPNLYQYCSSAPVNRVDPLGTDDQARADAAKKQKDAYDAADKEVAEAAEKVKDLEDDVAEREQDIDNLELELIATQGVAIVAAFWCWTGAGAVAAVSAQARAIWLAKLIRDKQEWLAKQKEKLEKAKADLKKAQADAEAAKNAADDEYERATGEPAPAATGGMFGPIQDRLRQIFHGAVKKATPPASGK